MVFNRFRYRFPMWVLLLTAFCVEGTREVAAQELKIGLTPDKSTSQFLLDLWTTKDGLPSNTVNDVLQDSDGYLWLTTYNGLVRYDGKTFVLYDKRNVPELRNNSFLRLFEDKRNDVLWATTQGSGVVRIVNGKPEVLGEQKGLPGSVLSILVDSKNNVWAGTVNKGLYRYENNLFQRVNYTYLTEVTVNDIEEDKEGRVWFSTEGRGLVQFYNDQYTIYNIDLPLGNGRLADLYSAPDSTLWVGTWDGVFTIKKGKYTVMPLPKGSLINRMVYDGYSNMWIGSNQGLFRFFPDGTLEQFSEANGLPNRDITSLCFDHESNLWVGTMRGGMCRLQDGKFENYTMQDGLASDHASVAYELAPGKFLVGTDNGKVNVLEKGKVSTFPIQTSIPQVWVRDILKDRNGVIWIATYAGLLRIENGKEKFYTLADGLPSEQLRVLFEDSQGNIWVGSRNAGLIKVLPNDKFGAVNRGSGLGSDFIMSIDEDKAGNLVLGTNDGGLNIVQKNGIIVRYSSDDGLPGSLVFRTYTDAQGAMWVCSNGGIARFKNGQFVSVSQEHGLPTDTYFDFLEDNIGNVWLPSSIGLVRISKKELDDFVDGKSKSIKSTLYDRTDGMKNQECTGTSRLSMASDGRIWVPTLGGVAVISPNSIPINSQKPNVLITELLMDGMPVDLGGFVEIPAKHTRLSIKFTALSLKTPSKVTFKYKLEPFDANWSESKDTRVAEYTNLPPGNYVFSVLAANNDGIWNDTGATLKFTKQPFLYQTPIFYVACFVVVILSFFGIYKWRLDRIKKEKKNLEYVIMERTAEIRQQKEEIQSQVEKIEEQNGKLLEQTSHLQEAYREIEAKNASLEEQKAEISRQAEHLQFKVDTINTINFLLEKQKQDILFEIDNLEEANDSIRKKYSELERKTSQLSTETDSMKEAYDTLATVNYLLERQKQELMLQADDLEEANEAIREKNKLLERQKNEIEKQNKLIEDKNEKLELAQATINEKNAELESINQNLEIEVQKRTQELKEAYNELLKANYDLDLFIYNASHDLAGPIARISGLCYAASLDIRDLTALDYLQRLEAASEEMSGIVTKLKHTHDLKSKKIQKHHIDLAQMVEQVRVRLLKREDLDGYHFDVKFSGDALLESDPELVDSLIEIVLQNAIRFRNLEVDQINVDVTSQADSDNQLNIAVRNNGIGVEEAVKHKIFDVFFIGSKQSKGHGLGLYQAKSIMQKLGGKIELANGEPGNTIFKITLPISG